MRVCCENLYYYTTTFREGIVYVVMYMFYYVTAPIPPPQSLSKPKDDQPFFIAVEKFIPHSHVLPMHCHFYIS